VKQPHESVAIKKRGIIAFFMTKKQ